MRMVTGWRGPMKCFVGIDDTDSSSGLCTTYLAFKVASQSTHEDFRVFGYPRLVRLNPNIPFKTRGNAAVCLPLETDDPAGTFQFVCSVAERLSDVKNGANTGVVFLNDPRVMPFIKRVYLAALHGLVNRERISKLLREMGVPTFQLGNGMGLVGAASSVAFDESYDHTYELIAYRRREFWGTPRRFDSTSVRQMDRRSFPDTFNNYDYQKERPLVAPHGPDPVFLGIRGASPSVVLKAFGTLGYDERLEGHMIYLSNQCTDAHLELELGLPLKAYSSGWIEGRVASARPGRGSHVYIGLRSRGEKKGKETLIGCAVYQPTGDLHRVARLLLPGDRVRVAGGVRRPSPRHERVVNVESIEVLSLASEKRQSNPSCPDCGSRMKSEGAEKGYECRGCGRRLTPGARKTVSLIPRRLRIGRYLSSPRAHRHLTKPLMRYGRETTTGERQALIDGWLGASAAPISLKELVRSR